MPSVFRVGLTMDDVVGQQLQHVAPKATAEDRGAVRAHGTLLQQRVGGFAPGVGLGHLTFVGVGHYTTGWEHALYLFLVVAFVCVFFWWGGETNVEQVGWQSEVGIPNLVGPFLFEQRLP